VRPEPNHVYVLPPNPVLTIQQGFLELAPRVERFVMTIDGLFRSLATDQKNRAIGIVLSGMDSDGALGLKAIKGEGGISIVQAPESARFPGMPVNSIETDT
jgi:two-component system CheB/CheR fusion protein